MIRFRGWFDSSDEARRHYQQDTLKHSWAHYQNVNMDDAKRSAIDAALDAAVAENVGSADIDAFIKAHPEVEIEANAIALKRYFDTRHIRPPYRLFDLLQAYDELSIEGQLVGA